jgi:hypothetical protein
MAWVDAPCEAVFLLKAGARIPRMPDGKLPDGHTLLASITDEAPCATACRDFWGVARQSIPATQNQQLQYPAGSV